MPETPSPIIVAVDQGTSSTKALALDAAGAVIASVKVEVSQSHPQPGWVEQDATEIFASVATALVEIYQALAPRLASGGAQVRGIGLSTQRESAVIWDRVSGKPLGPLLGWQDRRTSPRAQQLVDAGHADHIRRVSGLPIDPMFSALKFGWLLDEVDPDRSRSQSGEIAVGTVDSWIVFNLTREHRIEAGNASRTQLLSLDDVAWDEELADLFRIPLQALPTVTGSALATETFEPVAGAAPVAVHGVLGDSHAALFGHGVRGPGRVKATMGTGSSVMGISEGPVPEGLVRTIAWMLDEPVHAFEGNILSSGSTLVWLADVLGTTPTALVAQAQEAEAADGLNLVPAFSGLGAPWWDPGAQAAIAGLNQGTSTGQIARAAVDSIVLQIEDVVAAAESPAARITEIMVDGGPSSNDWLMQLQADLSQRNVSRSSIAELSAVGAAHLAGLSSGVWSEADLAANTVSHDRFSPVMPPKDAARRRASWALAVQGARSSPLRPPPTP